MLTIQQLQDLGIEVRQDPDQPGMFLWVHDQEGSDVSFDTEALAQAHASDYAKDIFTLSVCQNCEKMHSDQTLEENKDFDQRVSPGEICPSGQCPDCGAVCHLYREPDQIAAATDEDFESTLKSIEGYLANKADQGDTVAGGLVALLKPWLQVRPAAMTLNDSGVAFQSFASEEERIRHFATLSAIEDDHYFMDVRGVLVDVGLATVGPEALEDL